MNYSFPALIEESYVRSLKYPDGAVLQYYIFIDSKADGLTPLGGPMNFITAYRWAKSLTKTFPFNDLFLATRVSYDTSRDVEWKFESARKLSHGEHD